MSCSGSGDCAFTRWGRHKRHAANPTDVVSLAFWKRKFRETSCRSRKGSCPGDSAAESPAGDGCGRRSRFAGPAGARFERNGNRPLAARQRRRGEVPVKHVCGSNERAMKQKLYATLDQAVADIPDGAQIMFGGLGGAGCTSNLIQALARTGTRSMTEIRH